jgi:hypothetical protein
MVTLKAGKRDLVASGGEHVADRLRDKPIVVYHQDACHRFCLYVMEVTQR